MWAVVFVGYLYFSIAQSFSLRTRTNSSYPWLESLEACSKINMTLASQRDVCNTTVLHPSQTEPYWIQELYIIKMFEKVENSSAYNDSYSITINNENIRNQCTGTGTNSTCSGCNDDACNSNLVQLSSFNQFKHRLTPNVTYRIGYVNYTSILEEKHPSMLIFCVLYYNGKIFYDKCSNQRRAVCISGDIQKYVVSKIESLIERYPHQPSSAGGSTTITNTISCHTDFNLTSNTITPSNNDILKAKPVTFVENVTLTWNESMKYCERIGKVLFRVRGSESIKELNNTLKDRDQTWVDATVELSDFFKMPVCMSTSDLQGNKTSKFDTDIVSNCLTFCKDFQYFGLKESECYCIVNNKSLNTSKACKSPCNNDSTHQCGGKQSFSLYEKAITHQIEPGYKECVYVQASNNTTKLFTASCVLPEADGGLCETQNNTKCTNNNWTSIGSHMCRMDLKGNFSWKQTKSYCAQIEGQLYSSYPISLDLEEERKYWLGIYRVATFREKKEGIKTNHTYRSVAIKVGDNVLIEAEDSKANHTILCEDETPMRSSSSPRSTTSPGKGNSLEPCDATCVIGLIAALSAMMLVVSLITCLVCHYRRRHLSQEYENVGVNQSSRLHVQGSPQLTEERNYLTAISGGLNPITNDNYDSIMSEQSVHGAGSSNITEDQNYLTVLSSDLNPVPSETYEQLRLEQFLDNEYFEHKYECIKKDKMYANTD